MNKTETKQIQFNKDVEQEQFIGYWIRRYGITKKVLDNHPCADDIVALVKIREYLKANKDFTTLSHDAKIGVMWQSVYNRRRKLYPKHYQTLENIVLDIEFKKQAQAIKKQQMTETIKKARIKANG
jgi:hypothetical protein